MSKENAHEQDSPKHTRSGPRGRRLDRDTCDLIDAVDGKVTAHRDKVFAAWKALASGASPAEYAPFIRAVAEQVVQVEEKARELSASTTRGRKTPQALNSARIKDLGRCLGLGGTPDRYAAVRQKIDEADVVARFDDHDASSTRGGWILSEREIKKLIEQHRDQLPFDKQDADIDDLWAAIKASTKRGASRKK